MIGDMSVRGLHGGRAGRVIRTEIEKGINRLDEQEVAAARHISVDLRVETSYSKDFPLHGLRKTLAAPFLPSCGPSTPTHFYPKCNFSKTWNSG